MVFEDKLNFVCGLIVIPGLFFFCNFYYNTTKFTIVHICLYVSKISSIAYLPAPACKASVNRQ